MRVLHLNSEKSWRGGERQTLYLIQALEKEGVHSFLACKKDSALQEAAAGHHFPCFGLAFLNAWDVYTAWQLRRLCLIHQIDLMHAHTSHAHSLAFLSLLFAHKTPLLVTRRVDYPLSSNFFSRYKYESSSVKKIICVSAAVKKAMREQIQESHKLEVIHSGIDIEAFSRQRGKKSLLREQYSIPENSILIGNSSALSPQKDYYSFIDTAALVLKKRKNTHFFIIGEGKSKAKLQAYAFAKKIEQNLHFTGFRNDIEYILPELDIFLFTSQDEALGTAILNAFAASVPVVSTNVGGISELISHEQNGLLASKKDAPALAKHVLNLIGSPQLRAKLVRMGRKKVKDFSYTSTAKKNFQVYQEVLAQAGE